MTIVNYCLKIPFLGTGLLFMLWVLCPGNIFAQTNLLRLWVDLTGLKNNQGQVVLTVYTDSAGFHQESPSYTFYFSKDAVREGKMSCLILLPPGEYGISFIDDENNSGKLERNWFGYPQEGFGFSGLEPGRLRKPAFREFSFQLNENGQRIRIKAQYG